MPIQQGSYQKARLEIEGQAALPCWFNPSRYAISKANQWHSTPVVGAALPAVQFGGGLARELKLELLFDAVESGSQDVRGVTDRLFMMMEATAHASGGRDSARPPAVTFAWGPTVSFKAVARHLDVQYTLFARDGTPIRAQCTLTLVQIAKADSRSAAGPAQAQNPTTRATTRIGVHVVVAGDSLPSIAQTAYGDPTRWREIAQANAIEDPLRLQRGRALAVPHLDSQ
jgi:hypothetical protein